MAQPSRKKHHACRKAAQTTLGNCHIAINNPNPSLRGRDEDVCLRGIKYVAQRCLGYDVFIPAHRVMYPSISNPPYGEMTSRYRPRPLDFEDFEDEE